MKRAFVSTLAAVAFIGAIILLVQSSQRSFADRDRALAGYTGAGAVLYSFDNAANQVPRMAGWNVSYYKTQTGLANITVSESFPVRNASAAYSNYAGFLTGYFGNLAGESITADFSSMRSGRTTLVSNSGATIYSDSGQNSLGIGPSSLQRATNASAVSISINTTLTLNASSPWVSDPNGDANVTLHLDHGGGSLDFSGRMNSSRPHYYWLNFTANGSRYFRAFFGNDTLGSGATSISSQAASGNASLGVLVPYQLANRWYYNASLNVTKAGLNRNSKIYAWTGG